MKPGLKRLTRGGWLLMAFVLIAAADTRAQNPRIANEAADLLVGETTVTIGT